MIEIPGITIPTTNYMSPEQRVVHNCTRSLGLLRAVLVRTPYLPERTWDPEKHLLFVYLHVPLYILVHEVAHVWVAAVTGCLAYPEFGLGKPVFASPLSPPVPFVIEDKEARDTMEDAARVLGLLLLTRWSGDNYNAFRAQLAEHRAMLPRRGARECLRLGLIWVDSYSGRLRVAPEDGLPHRVPPPGVPGIPWYGNLENRYGRKPFPIR